MPGLVLVLLCAAGIRLPAREEGALVFTRGAMGVAFQISLQGLAEPRAREVAEACFERVDELEALFNHWSEESAIRRLNADPRALVPVEPPDLFEALRAGLDFSESTEHAFDVTIAPVLRALGFYGGEGAPLSVEDRERLRRRVGNRFLVLEADPPRLLRARPGMEIDLSALAKGYAVERVVELLEASGVRSAFVAAGSSTVFGVGPGPGGRGWSFRVPGLEESAEPWWLVDEAVATSGSHSQELRVGGEPTSHLVDPATLEPVSHDVRLTVFRGPSALEADMASTALLVMGPERARDWFAGQGEAWRAVRGAVLFPRAGPPLSLGSVRPGALPRRPR